MAPQLFRSLLAAAVAAVLLAAPALPPAAAQAAAGAGPVVDMARLDYGLKARALADGVWVVEGTNADFAPANGCNIINTGFIATGAGTNFDNNVFVVVRVFWCKHKK